MVTTSAPSHKDFDYSFDKIAEVTEQFVSGVGLERYALYLMDYGAPVGYRLAVKYPERITALVVQNGNAYEEGIDNDFWKPVKRYWKEPNDENRNALRGLLTRDATKWQYTMEQRMYRRSVPTIGMSTNLYSTAPEIRRSNWTFS